MADLDLNEKLKEFFETSSFTKFLTGFINVAAATEHRQQISDCVLCLSY